MRCELLLLLSISLASCSHAPAAKEAPKPKVEPAAFSVPIVELSGDGTEMGAAHGQRFGPSIKQSFPRYFASYFQSEQGRQLAMMLATAFEARIAPEHLAEIRALAKQCQMDEREIMLANCFLDATPMVACSTITLPASASPDGVPRFGRNLDFPGFNIVEDASVVLIFRPRDRYAFASITWPGIVGVLSGMNEHGLTLANMEVDRLQRLPSGMPYMLLYRTILERCKNVNEAIDLLQKTPRQTANNLMLMDAAGQRAVCEITPEKLTVRRATAQEALISTNHHRGADLNKLGRCERYDYLHETAKRDFGHEDVRSIQHMLAGVAQGNMTLQSMIFEPSTRTLYLAVGANAPTHPYEKLDLKPLFLRR